jgi:hypothetical protein
MGSFAALAPAARNAAGKKGVFARDFRKWQCNLNRQLEEKHYDGR